MNLEPRTQFALQYAAALTAAAAVAIVLMDLAYPHLGWGQWALIHCKLADMAGMHPMAPAIALACFGTPLSTRAVTRLIFGH